MRLRSQHASSGFPLSPCYTPWIETKSHPPAKRILELDGLRALAALSVFASHAFSWVLTRVTGAGWIGVDLFFVISGYLITSILVGMRGSSHFFKNFYMRRTLRIFPPYYALFFLCLIAAGFEHSYHGNGLLWLSYALYGSSLTALQSWYRAAVAPATLANAMVLTWSLSIEEIFYLLWAPAVRFLRKRQLFLVIVSAILIAPVVRWYVHAPGRYSEYYFFPARMDALALGSLLALVRGPGWPLRIPAWAPAVALAVPLSWIVLGSSVRSDPLFAVFGYTLLAIAMAILVAFVLDRAATDHPVCRILRSRLLVRVGTISYMFYLIHLLAFRVVSKLYDRFLLVHVGLNRTSLCIKGLAGLVLTVLVAEISWRWFESPILRLKSRFQPELEPCGRQPSAEDPKLLG